ncbi:MAG: oligoendopeptidase F [Desulfobacterium sp.]|nr:oligoendopeptidase F [Desulfobacterium sp.]
MSETVKTREQIPKSDQWNLDQLFADADAWEQAFTEYKTRIPRISQFQGTLGRSAQDLKACLDFMDRLNQLDERLHYYAMLRLSEDAGDSENQKRSSRYLNLATKAQGEASYQTPEIQTIDEKTMAAFLADPLLATHGIYLEKLLRFKPHILTQAEERLLALQAESAAAVSKTFSALTDVDMDFGTVDTPDGPKPLSQSSFSQFLLSPDRELRKKAYGQFYGVFDGHKNTLASLYEGSIRRDVYLAKIKNYPSARAKALFPDKVPENVYDNLVTRVRHHLPSLHGYYALRKKIMGLSELRHYDVYAPLVPDVKISHTYEEAVHVIIKALKPLGEEYGNTLKKGLLGTWVDRYENKGKRSGAFSAGSYNAEPYILMNYKEDVLRDVFTLAHEGGHSMHSDYSIRNNPFSHYDYTIFEAEVASTFNEQLLFHHMMKENTDKTLQTYLIGKQIDDILATVMRQTMFAEFETETHRRAEAGESLSLDDFRAIYRRLLAEYFGPEMVLEEVSDLEGLRIPHFYRAFYVYKYATGLSAAIALSRRVLNGGDTEREDYLNFLKSGGSKYPLESLALAGVDMGRTDPIDDALALFADLVTQLESITRTSNG